MLDRHAVQALLKAGHASHKIAQQFGVSQRSIQRIAKEPPIETLDEVESPPGRAGRPGVAGRVRVRLRQLMEEDPQAPPMEYLRLLRAEGIELGESTFYRLFRHERGKLPVELMVRFEGVAGEFAQFDFGEVDIRLLPDGKKRRIHFAAYRLKYSRWVWVEVVPDERVESLVRALLNAFEHSGGVPLRVVFDRPKTVVVGYQDGSKRPIWHQTLAHAVVDLGFAIELCAPRSPEQKGSVENLVGFVKRRCFRARRFADAEADVTRQVLEWLTEVNDERPNRATRIIPTVRLAQEQARMKPVPIAPLEYGLRFPVHVGPTALVDYEGLRYAMPVEACGIPATLYLYPDRVRIVTIGGRYQATHPRFPSVGSTSYLLGQRSQQLALVAGARKRLYFMRERILELGPIGEAYLTELIHARPRIWKGDVERLFALLEELGDDRFVRLLQRAHLQDLYGAEYVVRLATRQEVAS